MSVEAQNNNPDTQSTSSTIVQEVDMMSIITDIKDEVTTAIDFDEYDGKINVDFPQFLSIWDDGVFVHMDLLWNKLHFIAFIDDLFSKGFFLKDINYTEFLSLYFENENYQNIFYIKLDFLKLLNYILLIIKLKRLNQIIIDWILLTIWIKKIFLVW